MIESKFERTAERPVSRGSVYVTLDRLEKKGYLRSWLAEPTSERGDRAKRFYEVEPAGGRRTPGGLKIRTAAPI